jgi:hypothetical protein
MSDRKIEYQSGATVAQRAPIYIDVNKDPRARNQAYLNLYSSRVGAEVVGVDIVNGTVIASSNVTILNGLAGAGNGEDGSSGVTENSPGHISVLPPDKIPPSPVTNLVASRSGEDIILTFTWDPSDDANYYIDRFLIEVRDKSNNTFYFLNGGYGVTPSFIDQNSTSQTLRLTADDLSRSGIELISNIDLVGVATADVLNKGIYTTAEVASFVSPLPQPIFTLSKGTDYYVVTLDPTNLATAKSNGFYEFIIEEKITTELIKANVSLSTGWLQASPNTSVTPSVVYVPDGLHRWVRVKYISRNGNASVYSDIADITPDAFMPVNTNPPTQFTSASIAWSGNDIAVTFAQPSSNAGTTIRVKLVPYVNDAESASLYAYYSHIIAGSETSFKIKSLDLYGQFGTYYSKFKAYITSLSSQGVESTGTIISAGPVTRSSTLSTIYPTIGTPNSNSPSGIFRVTPISNGYVVDFDLPEGATRLEVYEKSSAWTQIPTDDTSMVYSGLSPATVITPDYAKRYVIVRFYDQYDNTSYYSMAKTGQTSGVEVTPINVGTLSLISNPIKIQTDGSIFAGAGDSTVYPQVFFNKDGLFAYDTGGTRTTQIVNNAISGGPTFITTSAQIANWTITSNKIENTLYGVGTSKNYAGLSANGTYAFWAGSDTAGGDATSKFSVTHAGIVTMRDVHIVGDPGDGTNTSLAIGGSDSNAPFRVTTSGAMTATSANITGSITVNQQSYFNANVNIGNSSYLISTGTTGQEKLQIGSLGLEAVNSSGAATTKIYSTPVTAAEVSGISLWSSKALFGATESTGWLISDGVISSTNISLDSANQKIEILSATSNGTNGIILKAGGAQDTAAIQVGKISGLTAEASYFYVTHAGSMFASNATIKGILKGGTKTGSADTTNAGYYFDAGGSAIIGGAGTANPQAIFNSTGIIFSANDVRARYTIPNKPAPGGTYTYVCPGGYFWDGTTCAMYVDGVGFVYTTYLSRTITQNAVGDSAYSGPSKIELGPSGVYITGLPRQGDMDNQYAYWRSLWAQDSSRGYLNVKGLGPVPRQRAIVEDPVDGIAKLGFAVYYQDSNVSTTAPGETSGIVGDLWVQY